LIVGNTFDDTLYAYIRGRVEKNIIDYIGFRVILFEHFNNITMFEERIIYGDSWRQNK